MTDPVLVFAPMSKETASDLNSHIDLARETALEFSRAIMARDQAERVLAEFIWKLQQAPKVTGGVKCFKCGTVVTCDCGIPNGGKL